MDSINCELSNESYEKRIRVLLDSTVVKLWDERRGICELPSGHFLIRDFLSGISALYFNHFKHHFDHSQHNIKGIQSVVDDYLIPLSYFKDLVDSSFGSTTYDSPSNVLYDVEVFNALFGSFLGYIDIKYVGGDDLFKDVFGNLKLLEAFDSKSVVDTQPNNDYVKQLHNVLASMRGWKKEKTECGPDLVIKKWMQDLLGLYGEHFQYHPDQVRAVVVDYQGLIAENIDRIEKFCCIEDPEEEVCLESGICCADLYKWDHSFWYDLSLLLSSMNAFNSMFGHIVKIKNKETIRYVFEKNLHVTLSEVPKNIPKNDWWWFVYEPVVKL